MSYLGQVKNGRVQMTKALPLPDGTLVEVRALSKKKRGSKGGHAPTLFERYEFLVGQAKGWPSDFSINLDHYLYGAPKKK